LFPDPKLHSVEENRGLVPVSHTDCRNGGSWSFGLESQALKGGIAQSFSKFAEPVPQAPGQSYALVSLDETLYCDSK